MNNNLNGSEIRKMRKAMKLSQIEFADRLHISNTYLSDIENDKKVPSDTLLSLISSISTDAKSKAEKTDYGGMGGLSHELAKAVALTSKVISSPHKEIAKALMKNLEQFSEAVDGKNELDHCKAQLKEQDVKLKSMEEKINSLQDQVTELLSREPQGGSVTPGETEASPGKKAM